jgi:hypothetical protein
MGLLMRWDFFTMGLPPHIPAALPLGLEDSTLA